MYAEIHKAAALKEGEAEAVAVAVKAQPMRLSSPENKKGDHIKGGAVVCEAVPCCRPSYRSDTILPRSAETERGSK